jgi:hypothetical protein
MQLQRKGSSGVSSSNGGGSGNNSDNSGILSIGNNSFGFNFDTDEGMMNSSSMGDGDGRRKPPTRKRSAPPTEQELAHSQAADKAVASLKVMAMPYTKEGRGTFGTDGNPLLH